MSDTAPDFTRLPDLGSRALGGSVVFANDDLFAEKENLITPGPAGFAAERYGPRGKVYDGWETRRRREPGHDHAIIRLGVPGLVHGVVVDTAHWTVDAAATAARREEIRRARHWDVVPKVQWHDPPRPEQKKVQAAE